MTIVEIVVFLGCVAASYYVTGLLRSIVRHLDRIATCLEKGGRLLDGARWQIEGITGERKGGFLRSVENALRYGIPPKGTGEREEGRK